MKKARKIDTTKESFIQNLNAVTRWFFLF